MIVDILFEVFFEIIVQGYVWVSMLFIPKRHLSERIRNILTITFVLIGLAMFVALIVGVVFVLTSQGASVFGWVLTGIGIVYLVLALILKIISKIKKK